MASPAEKPCVKRDAHASRQEQEKRRDGKENAPRRQGAARRAGRVLQPTQACERAEEATRPGEGVLPRKRRFGDAVYGESSNLGDGRSTVADIRVSKRVTRDSASVIGGDRVNPFDAPLQRVVQTTPAVRAYRQPRCVGYARVADEPPPRGLVSYDDLWEGVSAIADVDDAEYDGWGFDGFSPRYDFLYDGVWKRCVGQFVVPVEKACESHRGHVFSGRKRRKKFVDLDRPVEIEDAWRCW